MLRVRIVTIIVLTIILDSTSVVFSQTKPGLKDATLSSTAKSPAKAEFTLNWNGIVKAKQFDESLLSYLSFEGCQLDPKTSLPYFHLVREVSSTITLAEVSLDVVSMSQLSTEERKIIEPHNLSSRFTVTASIRRAAGKTYEIIEILPLKESGGRVDRLEAFNITVKYSYGGVARGSRTSDWVSSSILSSGQWYKVAVGAEGVYKVNHDFMQACGFDMNGVQSSSIRIYGAAPGMISMDNSDARPDDLQEISLLMVDGGDGTFDNGDHFLFYGEDQVIWEAEGDHFVHQSNPFADSVFYFITTDAGFGQANRVLLGSQGNPNKVVNTYDFYDLHEDDRINLIKSGREWFGEQLGITSSYDFGFTVPDADVSKMARVRARFALRSVSIKGPSVVLSLSSQGANAQKVVPSVPSGYAQAYAAPGLVETEFRPRSNNFLTKISIDKTGNANALAWLDYIEVSARRSLVFFGSTMNFRDRSSVGIGNVSEFRIASGGKSIFVWDVTDRAAVLAMNLRGSPAAGYSFISPTDSLKEFIAFVDEGLPVPSRVGAVEIQNLHAMTGVDYLVISHRAFMPYAQQLADHHSEEDGFSTAVVDVATIYNEFSGGAQDITALREFVRMLRTRSMGSPDQLKYLLLFGDASYDYKDRVPGNSNFVPAYQTQESLQPTASVVSDDFYGLLDEEEVESTLDLVDIAIGRLPARSKTEAEQMVNKIVYYSESSKTFGDWRNWVALVADDPEYGSNTFQRQSSLLASLADSLSPEFNIHKIYLDGFKQESGAGGERYPTATEAISDRVRKGALLMYYTGHGGELGWAHERVLEVPIINKWENLNNLPLFVTATCEFTRYDDPRRTSAGEYLMLNPSGGGIALLTTTRAVYSGPNFDLTFSFTKQAFEALSADKPRIGDMAMQTKIENASGGTAGLNTRCFALIGDPAMKLAFPEQKVVVTNIPDTIKALDKIKVSGFVADHDNNILTGFNGLVYPTMFDKEVRVQGQNNDGEGIFFWQERRNILFRGKASVKNGKFEFEFVVPKDINREYGGGKLSFYAHNGVYDASGADFNFQIGGLSDNPIVDNEGPLAELYMNNNKFVFGGMTNEDPDLYAEIWDENGINMVGTGIGHDITAVLDNKASSTIVLNDFYEADVDSYQSGKIKYPFQDLDEGQHSLRMQVWDVNNNPSDANTEFIVANDEKLALDHVLNYPNPFTTNTDFYFEHNKPGLGLDVRIEIFTISGKLVKTIDGVYANNGFRIGPINWNGRDEYGDTIGKGVYLYRVKVKTPTGDSAEEYERLVILK